MSEHLDEAKKVMESFYNPRTDEKVGVATAHALIAIAELLEQMVNPTLEQRIENGKKAFDATVEVMHQKQPEGMFGAAGWEEAGPSAEETIEDIYKIERDLMSQAEFKRQHTSEPVPYPDEDICRICRSVENEHDLFHTHKFATYNIPGGESNLSGSDTYDGI